MDFKLRRPREKLKKEQKERKERAKLKLDSSRKAKEEVHRQREALEAVQRQRRLDAAEAEATVNQLLEYSGGPKLRKWYGAPDPMQKDGVELGKDENPEEEEEVRDAVLVTNGDNEIGQMIILSLIVKRIRVKAVVKDKRVAMEAFGTYVESMAGDTKDEAFFKKAFRGVRAVICPVEGSLYNIDSWKGIQHVILLSQLIVYRNSTGLQAVINSNARKLAEQDENAVKISGVPYTIIRTGLLKNTPEGQQGFCFEEVLDVHPMSPLSGYLSAHDAIFSLDEFHIHTAKEWKQIINGLSYQIYLNRGVLQHSVVRCGNV